MLLILPFKVPVIFSKCWPLIRTLELASAILFFFFSVIPKWIAQGETFKSEVNAKNCAGLECVEGVHPLLARRIKENLKQWFPVQTAILPHLIAATNACSVLPPRSDWMVAVCYFGKIFFFFLSNTKFLEIW